MKLSEKIPPHNNLGEITFLEEDDEGDKLYYRECLTRWSDNEMKLYLSDKDERCWFGWVVTGASPIFGVSAWLLKGEEI